MNFNELKFINYIILYNMDTYYLEQTILRSSVLICLTLIFCLIIFLFAFSKIKITYNYETIKTTCTSSPRSQP
ncbi:putative ORFan [Cotonvirus japonicus]|uniref:ORFan n=1 Tax=Cotonvirus japonicus TaxID=2811091 RepID=A0ABM7NRB5_9VIRU|nr:putative ORFan [Cotonvirus japonicus]BCS82703.1 putative ORFan [Cotonvirus japonicus]